MKAFCIPLLSRKKKKFLELIYSVSNLVFISKQWQSNDLSPLPSHAIQCKYLPYKVQLKLIENFHFLIKVCCLHVILAFVSKELVPKRDMYDFDPYNAFQVTTILVDHLNMVEVQEAHHKLEEDGDSISFLITTVAPAIPIAHREVPANQIVATMILVATGINMNMTSFTEIFTKIVIGIIKEESKGLQVEMLSSN